MRDSLASVNRRLGLVKSDVMLNFSTSQDGSLSNGETAFNYDDLMLVYEACRLEHGLYWGGSSSSPWCGVLTPEVLRVLEYGDDLKYYREHGYGSSIAYTPACTILRDILQHFIDDDKVSSYVIGNYCQNARSLIANVINNCYRIHPCNCANITPRMQISPINFTSYNIVGYVVLLLAFCIFGYIVLLITFYIVGYVVLLIASCIVEHVCSIYSVLYC